METMFLLYIQFFFPIVWGVACVFLPRDAVKVRVCAIIGSLVYLAVTLLLFLAARSDQHSISFMLLPQKSFINLSYTFAVDGLSGTLLVMNSILFSIIYLVTWDQKHNDKIDYFLMFFIIWASNGAILSKDLFTFYIFEEMTLIPFFLMINSSNKYQQTNIGQKYILSSGLASLLMFCAMVILGTAFYQNPGNYSFTVDSIQLLKLPLAGVISSQSLIFLLFFLAFAIKIPLFPFYSWSQELHQKVSTSCSLITTGLLLNVNMYGLIKFVVPAFPEAVMKYHIYIIYFVAVGIFYCSCAILSVHRIRTLLSMLFLTQVGYVFMGIFAVDSSAKLGALLHLIGFVPIVGGMFIVTYILSEKLKINRIDEFNGLISKMPLLITTFFIMILGCIGFPLTSGFAGHLLVFMGSFKLWPIVSVVCVLSVIFITIRFFIFFQNVIFSGNDQSPDGPACEVRDLSIKELLPLMVLIFIIFLLGLYPTWVVDYFQISI